MFKSILLPTDGSQLSERATQTAIEFAKIHGARITAVSVVQPLPFVPLADAAVLPDPGAFDREMRRNVQLGLDKVLAAASAAGIECETVLGEAISPYEVIVRTAEERHCDIILMASHGRTGLNRLFLGSETQKVLAHTHLPVLVLR
ncbi:MULTISPECIES: universal stress protein [unclassified Duganella]|uniref:universal stress protein n=1 Tax=unclassified Duganella TaxID=2636909 RepID=UPI0006F72D81|nr:MULTISPECIES: universal stress protein [unclassified Duganella]KQV44953.1 universal stress protein [Duganella sp. Root336D2]KRB92973.1 universal stress protein [Duganella sp. Root198D2]